MHKQKTHKTLFKIHRAITDKSRINPNGTYKAHKGYTKIKDQIENIILTMPQFNIS